MVLFHVPVDLSASRKNTPLRVDTSVVSRQHRRVTETARDRFPPGTHHRVCRAAVVTPGAPRLVPSCVAVALRPLIAVFPNGVGVKATHLARERFVLGPTGSNGGRTSSTVVAQVIAGLKPVAAHERSSQSQRLLPPRFVDATESLVSVHACELCGFHRDLVLSSVLGELLDCPIGVVREALK